MKPTIIIILIGAALTAGVFLQKNHTNTQTNIVTGILEQGKSCYEYVQEKTIDAPYEVFETMVINNARGAIIGEKSGTQAGLDMTNGYYGTIKGTYNKDVISVRFSAEIEGSSVIEQEIYSIASTGLVKHRYPLVDKGGELVPDLEQPFTDLVYKKVDCTQENTEAVPHEEAEKVVTSDVYEYNAPQSWTASFNTFDDCLWGGLSNDTSDGHRMAGEIGIYPKLCFDISKSNGKREISEKDGYFIIAYYDSEAGTTEDEITETKKVFNQVVASFKLK